MANIREVTKADGFGRGAETIQLSTARLRFFSSNAREQYGFSPDHEDYILSLIKDKYIDHSFTEEDKNFILANLVDPLVESNPESREFRKSMKWLVNSIIENGVIDPIRGFWNGETEEFTNTDGNRRLAAIVVARLMGTEVKSVRVLQEETKTTSANFEIEALKRQLLSNSGKEFNPIEEAKVLKRLQSLGASEAELVSLAGSKAILNARLALLDLAKSVQLAVSNGDVLPTVAIQVTEEALENGLTHDEVSEAVQEAVAEVKDAKKNGKTKANKASKSSVQAKVKAVAERNGKTVQQKKSDDPAKKSQLLADIQYMIQHQNALEEANLDELTQIFKLLNKG